MLLYCDCANTQLIDPELKQKIKSYLGDFQDEPFLTSDLCGMIGNRDEKLTEIVEADNLKIIACYPRAIKWLFNQAGLQLPDETEFLNMKEASSEGVDLFFNNASVGNNKPIAIPEYKDEWIPWFPVIDYDRCVNCKQCLSFCLFDTYVLDDQGIVTVQNPSHCKNNCPACARICPEAAIIFPKLDEAPINGSVIGDEDAVKSKIKLNVEQMLGNDIYAALEKRKQKKKQLFSKTVDLKKAMQERAAHTELSQKREIE